MVNFLKFKWLYYLISATVILSGIFSIFKWGYKYSIDFVGGTNLEYTLEKQYKPDEVKKIFKNNNIEVVDFSLVKNQLTVRTKAIDEKVESKLKDDLSKFLSTKIIVQKSETVGPVLGKETMYKTLIAAILATIGILIYMSFAFKGFNYAFSAVLAMFHDLLVVIGVYSLFSHFLGAEVDTMFVTAVLTSLSFSVHDTIIIFDKIREYKKQGENFSIEEGVNKALTETMVRSTNNSMTIIFMLLALTLLGGSTIRFFIATLLVGTITGTYSSPFVATPLLVWMEKMKKKS